MCRSINYLVVQMANIFDLFLCVFGILNCVIYADTLLIWGTVAEIGLICMFCKYKSVSESFCASKCLKVNLLTGENIIVTYMLQLNFKCYIHLMTFCYF